MAFQSVWYETRLPDEIIDILEKDLEKTCEKDLVAALVESDNSTDVVIDNSIRKSKKSWLPSTHWIVGFVMHYVNIANEQNFCYDLVGLDGQKVQYTVYDKGEFYNWHNDQGVASYYKPISNQFHGFEENLLKDKLILNSELVRKLSFSLQLSDEDSYKGGELQIMGEDEKVYEVPKKKGMLVCFDSRARHCVNKVISGRRKSLVGWVVGPRWR